MAKQFIDHFIKNLQPEEVKSITRYIKNNTANGEESKTMEVLEAMLSGKEIRYKSQAALNKIKSRIFEKSLDGLLVDDQFLENSYCELDYEIIILRKQLVECRILQLNSTESKTSVIEHLINQIILKAKKYEIYAILIEALNLKKYFRGIRAGLADFEKIDAEIKFYELCNQAVLKAADNYYRLILDNDFIKQLSNTEVKKHIINSIEEMERDYKKTKAGQVNYYLHIMRFALSERQKNYTLAITHCNKLISILGKNKAIYRKERIGSALVNLSLFKIHLGNYSAAAKEAKHAQQYYLKNSLNYAISKEQEFYANFYNENYRNANKCIVELLNHSTIDTGEFRKSKFIYYQACTLFTQKEFLNALRLLHEALEIEKDKERWNISIRILTILIYIELNKLADASRTLEAMRKYMERNKINEKIKPRDQLIIKTLRELEKDDFVYTAANTAIVKLHKQLSADNTDVSWEYYSAELVKFHEWLKGRLVC